MLYAQISGPVLKIQAPAAAPEHSRSLQNLLPSSAVSPRPGPAIGPGPSRSPAPCMSAAARRMKNVFDYWQRDNLPCQTT